MDDCLFCKIVKGEIPATKVYEDEKVIAFNDIAPAAETHVLFIHKEHTKNVTEMMQDRPEQLKDIFSAIGSWTKEKGLDESGFRVVNNCGESAGQTVFHTHFHVLAGKKLRGFA